MLSKRNFLMIFAVVFAIFTFNSCKPWQSIIITSQQKKDEVAIMPELKQFLKENSKVSVVLRAVNTQSTATQETRNTELYNQIERKLMMAGFNVIDRTLLENLTRYGKIDYSNYEEIGKQLKTDIIIEITDELYKVETPYKAFDNKKQIYLDGLYNRLYTTRAKSEKYPKEPIKVYSAKFSFRVVLVKEGATKGFLTYYFAPCTDGCLAYSHKLWANYYYDCCFEVKNENSQRYDSYSISYERILEDLPNRIIQALQGN